jgi:mevalonate kinase
VDVGGTCVYLADPADHTKAAATSLCTGLGSGWGLCSSATVCQASVYAYLDAAGCLCSGGASLCNCLYSNIYVHVSDWTNSAWINQSGYGGCTGSSCAESGSGTCGAVLCCN